MTRSHKYNDRPHAALKDGTALPEDHLPKYFAKSGYADAEPKKIKKNGGGKNNWGEPGEEVVDGNFSFTNARRRSNSSTLSTDIKNFKTKFDVNEQEPVFESHMAEEEDEDEEPKLRKTGSSSGDSTASGSSL